ncbi:MAG: carbohydrate kinase [Gammaproteobacteria bacterium]|nr:MAG: carbohydrate kinase [Gammaproteobacteria bacterium]
MSSNTKQARILTVTVNPALDMASSTPRVEPDHKLRCTAPTTEPGGGGVNVSRACRLLGGESDTFTVLGGAIGKEFEALLRKNGLEPVIAEVTANTRIAIAISDDTRGGQYRFGFPGEGVTAEETAAIRAQFRLQLQTGYAIVVLSGSLAPGMADDTYAGMIDDIKASGARAILDTHGPALVEGLRRTPWLIKLDYHEALEIFNLDALDVSDAAVAAEALREREAAEVVIITLREEGAVVSSAEAAWRITPPKVTVRSAIGAGDSFIGALSLAIARGESLEAACRRGVATAAATVATPGSALCERSMADHCHDQTRVEKIDRSR